MPQQQAVEIENTFIKGLVTSATPLTFPKNAVTSASNCVFDFLGTVTRREGIDLEVGNIPAAQNWTGTAISSFLWHNVLGDGTLNIYVVQVGHLLYFYPISLSGQPLSAQLISAPLDFSGMSSQANQGTLIAQNGSPVAGHIGNMTGGGGLNAGFDGITIQATSASSIGPTHSGFTVGSSTFSDAYIGQQYSIAQQVSSVTVYPTSDGSSGFGNGIINFYQGVPSNPKTAPIPATQVIVNLYGSNSLPANATNGTLLGSTTLNGSPTSPLTINNTNNTATTWSYVWVQLTSTIYVNPVFNTPPYALTGTSWASCIAEMQVYSPKISNLSPQVPFYECQYTQGLGYLFVTHPYCLPFVVTYGIGGIASASVTNFGVGYTTGVYTGVPLVPTTGSIGTGSGAVATITVTGGSITSFSLTSPGMNYTAGQVLTAAANTIGGSGSGFTVTVNAVMTTPTYVAQAITILIRDFDGVDDGLRGTGINTRPSTSLGLANQHLYNLYNQGWNSTTISTWQSTFANTYPSNCDVWWQLKNSSGVFTPSLVSSIDFGTAAAPNGSFIYDQFYIDRGANIPAGAGSLGVVTSGYNRPSTNAFFAGRIWYSGVQYPQYANSIWFSQVISPNSATLVTDLGHCYQAEDPSSETLFNLLPDDGGVIKIPDCGQIVKLFPMQSAILVFATNGIWVITGSQGGIGFTADQYSVNKLSAIRALSGTSFVDVLGMPYWWSNEGIYKINIDIQSGGMRVDSVTYSTINAFFDNIPRSGKVFARGYYNPLDYTVQWLYRSTPPVTFPDDNYKYDSALVFNTITGAFYPYTWVTGIDPNITNGTYPNIASTVVIETGGETDVIPTNITYTRKYLVTYTSPSTGIQLINIADNFNINYLDWQAFDGVGANYTSSFTSGFKMPGQAQKRWQPNYIYVFSNNATPTSYLINGIWNFANSGNSGKISQQQLVTINAANYNDYFRKHRIRGTGIVLEFEITSYANNPFDILGWSVWDTINLTA